MPRPRPVREPCDCLDCAEPDTRPPTSLQAAIARQEPAPPKSLLIYLHGALGAATPQPGAYPHVAAAVRDGCAGLLAFGAPGTGVAAAAADLLGLDPAAVAGGMHPTLGQRFKELAAAALTDTPAVAELCSVAGAAPVALLCPRPERQGEELPWPEPAQLARRITKKLGVPFLRLSSPADAPALAVLDVPMPGGAAGPAGEATVAAAAPEPEDDIDMLLLVLDVSAALGDGASAAAAGSSAAAAAAQRGDEEESRTAALEWLDSLLQQLNWVEGFRDTVLLSLVLGMQQGMATQVSAGLQQARQQLLGEGTQGPACPFRRPLQSFEFRGTERATLNPELVAVAVHRLPGVIRRDAVDRLDVAEVQRRGGGGCILAERVLPEIAYKLGRAPKYGA